MSAVALILGLAACSDDAPDADAPDADASGDGSARGAGGGDCTTEPAETDGLTDAGEAACLGTPVTMGFKDHLSENLAVVTMIVTGWERADDALIDEHLTSYNSELTASSRDLWFVRGSGKVVEESGEPELDGWSPGLAGLGDGNGAGSDGIGIAMVPDCEQDSLDGATGETTDLCFIATMPTGVEPTEFYLADSVEDGRGQSLLGSSIVWR